MRAARSAHHTRRWHNRRDRCAGARPCPCRFDACAVRSWRRRIRLCGRFPYRPTIGGACGMYRPPIGSVSAIERAIVCMRMPGLADLRQPISRGFLHTATSGAAPAFLRAGRGFWAYRRIALLGARRQIAHRHVVDHALAQRRDRLGHRWAPVVGLHERAILADRTPPTDDPTPIGTADGPKGIYGRRSLSKPPKPTILDLATDLTAGDYRGSGLVQFEIMRTQITCLQGW